MSGPRAAAPWRLTSGVLSGGAALAAACFSIALLADFAGIDGTRGELTDVRLLAESLLALRPWAWAATGTIVVIGTPAVGLVATAAEFASVSDRRTVLLALLVLAVLAVSLVAAILR